MTVSGLDAPCAVCERPAGDHTLREWAACMGTQTTDLPYEAIPEDLAQTVAASVRDRFQLDDDLIVADHVVVRALTLGGRQGVLGIKIPALIHDFQIGLAPNRPSPSRRSCSLPRGTRCAATAAWSGIARTVQRRRQRERPTPHNPRQEDA